MAMGGDGLRWWRWVAMMVAMVMLVVMNTPCSSERLFLETTTTIINRRSFLVLGVFSYILVLILGLFWYSWSCLRLSGDWDLAEHDRRRRWRRWVSSWETHFEQRLAEAPSG